MKSAQYEVFGTVFFVITIIAVVIGLIAYGQLSTTIKTAQAKKTLQTVQSDNVLKAFLNCFGEQDAVVSTKKDATCTLTYGYNYTTLPYSDCPKITIENIVSNSSKITANRVIFALNYKNITNATVCPGKLEVYLP